MRLERFGTQSLNTRRRSTWHSWRHRDDVPKMPRAVCHEQWLGIKQHGTIHGIFGATKTPENRVVGDEFGVGVGIRMCREYQK